MVLTADPDLVTRIGVEVLLDQGSSIEVRCSSGLDRHVVAQGDSSTEHQFWLSGLRPDSKHHCTLTAGESEGGFVLDTDPLPPGLREMELTVEGEGTSGYTLFNAAVLSGNQAAENHWLLVTDPDGVVRWYRFLDEASVAVAFDWTDGAFTLGGGLDNNPTWPQRIGLDGSVVSLVEAAARHDVVWHDGRFYALTNHDDGLCIEEWDQTRTWQWCLDDTRGLPVSRGNSLTVTDGEEGRTFVVSLLGDGVIFEVSRESGEVNWALGQGLDFEGLEQWFDWVHDVRVLSCANFDRCLTFYDNGTQFERSRVLKVGLSKGTGKVTPFRSYEEAGWFEPKLGGVDELSDGSWIIAQGHQEFSVPDSNPSAIVEVDPLGAVVWRMTVLPREVGIYRARHVDGCLMFQNARYCP